MPEPATSAPTLAPAATAAVAASAAASAAPPGVRGLRAVAGRVLPGPWTARRATAEAATVTLLGVLGALAELEGGSVLRAVGMGLAVAAVLLLRRGLPALVLVLAGAGMGGFAGFLPALVVAGWSAGFRIARPAALTAAFGTALAALLTTSLWWNTDDLPVRANLFIGVIGFLLTAVLPAVVGRYRAQRVALLDALRERNAQLLRERDMIAHQARLRERHRIAQDMHDSLGHRLALIAVHAGGLEVDRGLTERQREAVGVLRLAAAGAMRELREVVSLLQDDTLSEAGGVDAVGRLVESARVAGADVTLHHGGEPRPLPAAAGHAAYRTVQEGLTNALKHAPGAPIAVGLRHEPDALVVEVHNEPPAVPAGTAIGGGQGLTGLRERARLLGGMVYASRTPDGGFRLAGVFPYDGAGPAGGDPAEYPDTVLPEPPDPAERRRPLLGCAVGAVAVLLAALGVLGWGALQFFEAVGNATLPRATYDGLTTGQDEQEVRARLPVGSELLAGDHRGQEPPVPAGASCEWFVSGEAPEPTGQGAILRLCFSGGRLVEKQRYAAGG